MLACRIAIILEKESHKTLKRIIPDSFFKFISVFLVLITKLTPKIFVNLTEIR